METQKQSALQIIKAASLKEKLMLIYACTFQFIMSIPYAATPFWQMNPKFICQDGANSFQCSASIACSDKYKNTFTVDSKGVTKSIIIEKALYCEKQSIWANSQTLNMAVVLLITIVFLFKKVQPEQRYKYILLSQGLFVMAALLSITVSNLNVILVLLAILYLANQVFYLQMYPFLNSYMNPQLQTVGVALYNMFFALGFAVYPIFDSFIMNWKKMMLLFIATPVILNIIYIIFVFNNYLHPTTEAKAMTPILEAPLSKELELKSSPSKQDQERTSKFGLKFKESQLGLRRQKSIVSLEIQSTKKEELLKNYDELDLEQKQPAKIVEEQVEQSSSERSLSPLDIVQDKYLLQVTIIFIILVLSTGAAFLGSQFCINMLPVDVYSISIVLGISEAIASLYSAQITAKIPIKALIKYASLLIALTLLPFYFQDLKSNSSSAISSYIFFCLYVIGKTAMFVTWAFAFILLFQSTNSNAQGSIIVITQIVQMTVLSIIPQYNQMMTRLGINPVATYAIFSIVASFSVSLLKDKKNIEVECKKQSLKKSYKKLQQTANSSVSTSVDHQSALSLNSSNQLPVFAHNFDKQISIEMTPLSPQSHFLKFQEDA